MNGICRHKRTNERMIKQERHVWKKDSYKNEGTTVDLLKEKDMTRQFRRRENTLFTMFGDTRGDVF